jgi:hypothetical protein
MSTGREGGKGQWRCVRCAYRTGVNAQHMANTLWTYATMGRAPGAALMRELEGRAEAVAGTFYAHGVANTL